MNNLYSNNYPVINLYKRSSSRSEIVTQIIYGEGFRIISRLSKWLKIRIKEDKYVGYIKKKQFISYVKPTHKVSVLFAKTYRNPNFKKKITELPYAAKLKIDKVNSKFSKFQNSWIETQNIKPIKYKTKNFFKDIKNFNGVKYVWGGKTFKGIDCSALIQICLNFNNQACPRDSSQQIKFFKKNIKLNKIKKNDIIYWKGHVAVALSKKKLIHAYGPKKKTLIMNIPNTIKLIKKTANLKVISVKRI
ncbi:MAG: C40 family peptidase [Pelagibacteraceae bacterium]|jgi:gamma-D-glutamyl-L-lysine dipeptidyl-peptidase|nr:C40 family peptidase [Pelagibacteraceae bacterium]